MNTMLGYIALPGPATHRLGAAAITGVMRVFFLLCACTEQEDSQRSSGYACSSQQLLSAMAMWSYPME